MRQISIPKKVSLTVYDYDSKFPTDKDSENKPCKITTWKNFGNDKYQIFIYVKNKKIYKTIIPDDIDLQVNHVIDN